VNSYEAYRTQQAARQVKWCYGDRKELHAGRLLGEGKISVLEYLVACGDAEGGAGVVGTGEV